MVRAPHKLPEARILRFVEQKQRWMLVRRLLKRWIKRKIAEISSRPKALPLTQAQEQFYRALAEKVIPQRVKYYSELTGLRPNKVRISNAGKRWGSCSAKGTINIAWRLVQFPQEVVDYVVVHELAHLAERNHGIRFWSRVKEIVPQYKAHRRWLRQNGSRPA